MRVAVFALLVVVFFNVEVARSDELEVKTFQVRSAEPETLISVAEDIMSEEGKVIYDKRTNSLIVMDTPQKLQAITEIIEKIDVRLRQVQIKVIIADVSEGLLEDIGIKGASVVIPPDRFKAVLNLLKTHEDNNIRSESMVTTLSNQTARIQVTSDIIIGERLAVYNSDSFVVSPVTDTVGSVLEVLPRVNNDNTIVLHIQPSFSNIEDSTALPLKRSLFTNVVINNGDTIAIGGVSLQKRTSQKQSILGIPSSKTKTRQSRETIIFLTAKITGAAI